MLGLPQGVRACLFDLDGVLTDTASVHRKAWKAMFDAYLRRRAECTGEAFVDFDAGVVSSSANTRDVLEMTGLDKFVQHRVGQSEALRRNGADIVVTDLAELL